ncbi:hypothetical protein Tco_1327145 [Tanacetum coccineum]
MKAPRQAVCCIHIDLTSRLVYKSVQPQNDKKTDYREPKLKVLSAIHVVNTTTTSKPFDALGSMGDMENARGVGHFDTISEKEVNNLEEYGPKPNPVEVVNKDKLVTVELGSMSSTLTDLQDGNSKSDVEEYDNETGQSCHKLVEFIPARSILQCPEHSASSLKSIPVEDQLIRRIHQLDTTYQPFYSEQRIDLCSLNNVSVLPNNTAYSVTSIRRTDLQQTDTACMTRSSTKELITPFGNPERVFRSKRRLFETHDLVESSSPELGLFSDIEEHSEEETTEIMTETME